MCKVYTRYHCTSEIEHGLCACMVNNPLAKAQGLSLPTGAQTMLYLLIIEIVVKSEALYFTASSVEFFHCLLKTGQILPICGFATSMTRATLQMVIVAPSRTGNYFLNNEIVWLVILMHWFVGPR